MEMCPLPARVSSGSSCVTQNAAHATTLMPPLGKSYLVTQHHHLFAVFAEV